MHVINFYYIWTGSNIAHRTAYLDAYINNFSAELVKCSSLQYSKETQTIIFTCSSHIHPVHMTFKSIWNQCQSVWPSCERKQKVSNRFQTYLRVGLKSVWNQFEDINCHVNALATFLSYCTSTEKDDFRTLYRIKIEP